MAFSDSAVRISNRNLTDLANNDRVLSSAKLWASAFLMQKKKSFKNALNKIDPTAEPCGTLEILYLKSLLRFTVYCLPFSKYVLIGHYHQIHKQRVFQLASHGGCNQKLPKDAVRLCPQLNFYQDFLSILQVIWWVHVVCYKIDGRLQCKVKRCCSKLR